MTTTPHRVRPVGDRVLIRPHAPPTERATESGIVLPTDPAPDVARSGVVVSAGSFGEDWTRRAVGTVPEVGDVVLFGGYGGTPVVTPDGETLRLMDLRDVLAIVHPALEDAGNPRPVDGDLDAHVDDDPGPHRPPGVLEG